MKQQRAAGFLIAKIHQLSGRILTKKLKKHEITEINPAQGRIMFVLWRNDGISINNLAKETSLGKSTLTTMLERLEEAGHIKRIQSQEDKRKTLIHITEKEKKLQEKYIKVSKEMNDLFYGGFNTKEIDVFENYLERILNNLLIFSNKHQ
ncbi:MAG: MarR family winged helix-turn-helix transcriptional regulator [Candidatus Hodarchaeales archaeon]|jgi:DNA-binding MarR family transcriptional regulator